MICKVGQRLDTERQKWGKCLKTVSLGNLCVVHIQSLFFCGNVDCCSFIPSLAHCSVSLRLPLVSPSEVFTNQIQMYLSHAPNTTGVGRPYCEMLTYKPLTNNADPSLTLCGHCSCSEAQCGQVHARLGLRYSLRIGTLILTVCFIKMCAPKKTSASRPF